MIQIFIFEDVLHRIKILSAIVTTIRIDTLSPFNLPKVIIFFLNLLVAIFPQLMQGILRTFGIVLGLLLKKLILS